MKQMQRINKKKTAILITSFYPECIILKKNMKILKHYVKTFGSLWHHCNNITFYYNIETQATYNQSNLES